MKTQTSLLVACGLLDSASAITQHLYDGASCTGEVVGMRSIRTDTCIRTQGGGGALYQVSGSSLIYQIYTTSTCDVGTEDGASGTVSTWDSTTLCEADASALVSTLDGYESCSMDGYTTKTYNSDDSTCSAPDVMCQAYENGGCPWTADASLSPLLYSCNDVSEFTWEMATWPTTESTCGGQALSTQSFYYRDCYTDPDVDAGETITYETTSCGDDDDDEDDDEDALTTALAGCAFAFSFLAFGGVVALLVKGKAAAPMSDSKL
eukprot:CAMPEP_0114428648 /NCGR_PEP_ID=MMETSP0103-20121206/9046_1 /TAXON_ID=37642 ORGANISM="Paraphysomonas imperforata, Strain PA2" /NCGR_SAMPLE_ID=MMETSP0103 /ASSEMBLY_ACC=CAM_ASM_000201 /LENGTH=263 /DNA_ID=CAMNT_0001597895 /DNA_START=12 /DNA_END=803 /DNA_ORIENTATION=+